MTIVTAWICGTAAFLVIAACAVFGDVLLLESKDQASPPASLE